MTQALFHPDLDPAMLDLVRSSYGCLLLFHLVLSLPHARRFFLSERWGGYGQSCRSVDWVQNPYTIPMVMAVWLACAVCLILGFWAPIMAFVNAVMCRYFFVQMRWKGVLRGMGAPGFMTNWLAGAVFLLEGTRHSAVPAYPLAVLVLQLDFALIMFVAGWYKLHAGYFHNEGMEYGLVNPQWCYWWRRYRFIAPRHVWFALNNHMAWAGEIVAGALLLIPATRIWGALFLFLSFFYIACNIRLLMLPPMVMVALLLFFEPGTIGHEALEWMLPVIPRSTSPELTLPPVVVTALIASLWCYLILLPFAYAGMFYNQYRHARLPGSLQTLLDWYTNFFGLILWRVFSADITHFFVLIHHQPRGGGRRTLISRWGLAGGLRYSHVGEAITITSLFTTLKYYPSNHALFQERLLRYARTVTHPEGAELVFEYVQIRKTEESFAFVPVAEFMVDVKSGSIVERDLDEAVSLRRPVSMSPVHEAVRPGSYAPLRT